MEKMLKSKSFWLVAILIAAVIFAVGINQNKVYQSEIRLLFIPKNEVMATNIDQITENAKEIPSSLTFYDKLVEANPAIGNGIFTQPDKERRDIWNSKIKIERIDGSGIISVSAFDADQAQAEMISLQVANDLSVVIGKYYNTQTELDIRTIDGPIDYQVPKADFANWILLSILSGLVFSAFIFSLAQLFSERKFTSEIQSKKTFSMANLKKYEFWRPKKMADSGKTASAPDNLPIEKTTVSHELFQSEKKHAPHREATPEEVKERLNSLLRGNL